MREVDIIIPGNEVITTKEKLHPFEKANAVPERVIANAKMMVPIFSPRAFYIAKHSLLTLEDNSVGLVRSNHSASCFKIALTYSTFVFLVTLSLNIKRLV
jgi:hypothetical protein